MLIYATPDLHHGKAFILAGSFAGNLLAMQSAHFAEFFKMEIFCCLPTALPLQNVGSFGVLYVLEKVPVALPLF